MNVSWSSTPWPTSGTGRGRRARYRGTRKNLFDLRRVAVVHNLHVIARQSVQTATSSQPDSYLTDALGEH